jgi:hypothetical protein
MVTLTIKSLINCDTIEQTLKISNRALAEILADNYYDNDDVYAVEITSAETGELLYYKSKGI